MMQTCAIDNLEQLLGGFEVVGFSGIQDYEREKIYPGGGGS